MVEVIEEKRHALIALCRTYHVSELDVFGSAATGDFDEQTSDIDLLVTFDETVKDNRFDNFFAFRDELHRLFGRPVDLVEPGGLTNPYLIQSVNRTRRTIYAAPPA